MNQSGTWGMLFSYFGYGGGMENKFRQEIYS
jgi:hypothetical protein